MGENERTERLGAVAFLSSGVVVVGGGNRREISASAEEYV